MQKRTHSLEEVVAWLEKGTRAETEQDEVDTGGLLLLLADVAHTFFFPSMEQTGPELLTIGSEVELAVLPPVLEATDSKFFF